MQNKNLVTLSALTVLTACATDRALLFEGMGPYRLNVSTDDARARQYFDQGLALCHGFNHDEAARSFTEAAAIDPQCAIAYWGQAYALGPNYNLWDEGEDYSKRAHAALERARDLSGNATELERDLITALSTRFRQPRPETRTKLNQDYASAMRALWGKYPDHAEVGFLYADSLLCLHPWDQWEVDGSPKRNTANRNWIVGARYCKIPSVANRRRRAAAPNSNSGPQVTTPLAIKVKHMAGLLATNALVPVASR